MKKPPPPAIDAVILAAGGAQRMGGVNKGMQPFRGRPLIEHVIDRLAPQCRSLSINCRPEADAAFRGYGLALLHDRQPDLGPLGGVLSALAQGHEEWLLIVPCDTPQLPQDLLARLHARAVESGADVVSVDDGHRRQHGVLLLRPALREALQAYLDAGDRKLGLWLQRQGAAYADFSDQPAAFINLNREEDLRHYE